MLKIVVIMLMIVAIGSTVLAGEIYQAVTPDGKETDISKVKVRYEMTLEKATLEAVQKIKPDFKLPEPQMYRLELIDKEIADLQIKVADIQKQIATKQIIRQKVEAAAKTVILNK